MKIRLTFNLYLMSTAQLKEVLKKHIDEADDKLLKMIIAIVEVYQEEDPIVSYDVNNNPKRASELRVILNEQIKLAKEGKYISIDELDEKSQTWLKRTK